MKKEKRSLVGQTFNQLTVVAYSHVSPRGTHIWNCRCSCGNFHKASTGSLEHETVKSCGCRRKQPRIRLGFLSQKSLISQLMAHYKQGAKRRRLDFYLNFAEFQQFILQDCYYCGIQPSQKYRPTRYKSDLAYTGIDRVDNSIGYQKDNCVPCCKACNSAKSNMSQSEFLNLIAKIYHRRVVVSS